MSLARGGRIVIVALVLLVESSTAALATQETTEENAYLSWSEKEAVRIGRAMRSNGRVGGFFDTRIVSTHRSYNYKLRATWLTPEAIRASARLKQLEQALTDAETIGAVAEAEALGDTIIMVEIDPREGSGVIPRDWIAVLRPKFDGDDLGVRGTIRREGRKLPALAGAFERDYAYDVFWLSFPLADEDGRFLFPEDVKEAELVVRIGGKEGRVDWPIPPSVRRKAKGIVAASGRD